MTTALGNTLSLSYDTLCRLSSVSVGALTRQYLYRDISDTQTTTQVATVRYPIVGTSLNYDFNYTYDALGNVSSYALPDGTTVSFTYDDQGQLLGVTGANASFAYTYDNVGNILSTAENGETHTYTYGDSNWKDLLTAYDGQSITYDGSGNPTSYYNGTRWTMGWSNGRTLTSATDGTTNISYAYDLSGIRTGKTVGTVSSIYFYASGRLLREVRYNSADQSTAVLDFFYSYDGSPYAMKYNGTVYYFVTNLQGDVVMILNADGSLAGGYVYDPYGKVLSVTGTIAAINPLRYRGYYYDTETGFYYLHSRYYDPEIGRFINADGYASTGQGVVGHNMFAYCNNNPVNFIDLFGAFPVAAAIVIGSSSIIGGVTGALSAAATGGDVGTGIFKGILTGAAGAACGLYSNPLIGGCAGFAIDLGTQAVSQIKENGSVSFSDLNYKAATNTAIVTAAGVAIPAWGNAKDSLGAALGTSLVWAETSFVMAGTEISVTNSYMQKNASNNTKPAKVYTPKYPLPTVPNKVAQDRDRLLFNKLNTGGGYTPAMRKKLTVMERRLDP